MAFTADELTNIANAALDFYIKGKAFSQVIQARPFYDAMRKAQKTFPGGKGKISAPVKGVYSTTIQGYTHNDTVNYGTPANLKRAEYTWKEHHAGLAITLTELKHDGISVVDSARSEKTEPHSQRELTALTGLLEDKLEDLGEGWARSFSGLLLGDGTGDANAIAGIRALLPDVSNTGTRGGLDAAANAWWRHRSRTGDGTNRTGPAVNTGTTSLVRTIHTDMRQLRRYGGRPNFIMAGSDFLDALVAELLANGQYTQQGWTAPKSTDISVADVSYNGVQFQYEPGLDDASLAKYCYIVDTRRLFPYVMEGEDMKQHTPSRPYNQYVMYRAVTWTGQLVSFQQNCHEVIAIA